MPETDRERLQLLYEIAEDQAGYITAQQAREAGLSNRMQSYYVETGEWDREYRGIYSLSKFPKGFDDRLMVWYLWSAGRDGNRVAVISHDTALSKHELSTWTSPQVHLTVPYDFRRSKIPNNIVLHRAKIEKEDIVKIQRVPTTKPLKTIAMLLIEEKIPRHHLWEAMSDGLRRQLFTKKDFDDLKWTKEERIALWDCYEQQQNYQTET